jgi:hypothetical protein
MEYMYVKISRKRPNFEKTKPAWTCRDSNTIFTPGNIEAFVKPYLFLEACFDLISSPSLSMKIQMMDEKITENLEFKSPLHFSIFK